MDEGPVFSHCWTLIPLRRRIHPGSLHDPGGFKTWLSQACRRCCALCLHASFTQKCPSAKCRKQNPHTVTLTQSSPPASVCVVQDPKMSATNNCQ